MDGAHKGGRTLKEVVVGSKAEAAARRQRAQQGAAAAGRVGQAVTRAREKSSLSVKSKEEKEIAAEVARSMKKNHAQNYRAGYSAARRGAARAEG